MKQTKAVMDNQRDYSVLSPVSNTWKDYSLKMGNIEFISMQKHTLLEALPCLFGSSSEPLWNQRKKKKNDLIDLPTNNAIIFMLCEKRHHGIMYCSWFWMWGGSSTLEDNGPLLNNSIQLLLMACQFLLALLNNLRKFYGPWRALLVDFWEMTYIIMGLQGWSRPFCSGSVKKDCQKAILSIQSSIIKPVRD